MNYDENKENYRELISYWSPSLMKCQLLFIDMELNSIHKKNFHYQWRYKEETKILKEVIIEELEIISQLLKKYNKIL